MKPESRKRKSIARQRLANTRSMEMRIRGERLGTESAFHVNGINKQFPWIRARLCKEPCREERLSRNRIQKLSVHMWNANQRTTEAEEVDVTVEEKTLVVH
jgi:hypothetical protein